MASVNFKRIEDSANINSIDIEDGAFIVTGDGKTYVDFGTDRIPTSGTPDDEMSDTSHNTVENKVIKEYVDNNTNSLKPTLLWTNPSPTSTFGPQNITLSSSDYDFLEIYYYDWIDTKRMMSQKVIKGKNILINAIFYANTNFFMSNRPFTYNSGTSYSVGNCVALYGSSTFLVDQAINYVCVPVKIYGYKYS